ncbi:MAG: phosphoribosylanthranilate isomerase [Deltaproteobacteria bacterium]|nr:phosphoribosylanthranilate isomerase [Deltaproteobacteria bacterium]
MGVKVKICGITNADDAMAASSAGADAVGFVFWGKSPRFIEVDEAARIIEKLPPFITPVGVFVDEAPDKIMDAVRRAGLGCVQLHGAETPQYCGTIGAKVIKAIRVRSARDIEGLESYGVSAFLLDAYAEGAPGGTGRNFDWDIAVRAKEYGRVILSGGLNPENVALAIRHVRPYGVDVSSGVETAPGKKDPEKIFDFMKKVRKSEADI